jgi:hypothetical protein
MPQMYLYRSVKWTHFLSAKWSHLFTIKSCFFVLVPGYLFLNLYQSRSEAHARFHVDHITVLGHTVDQCCCELGVLQE